MRGYFFQEVTVFVKGGNAVEAVADGLFPEAPATIALKHSFPCSYGLGDGRQLNHQIRRIC